MKTVLLTGFLPFMGRKENPSQAVVEALHGKVIGGVRVESLVMPVEFGRDVELVIPAIRKLRPVAVISLGLAARAASIRVERIALNLRRVDVGETFAREGPVAEGGPAAYLATLPVEKIAGAMRELGIPAGANTYAGNYLCNHVMYQVLHHFAMKGEKVPSGFLHLPDATEFGIANGRMEEASLPLSQLVRAVESAIAVTVG